MGQPTLAPPPETLKSPSNHPLLVKGYFQGTLRLGDKESTQEVYVVRNLHQQLLGRPAIKALGLIVRAHAINRSQSVVDKFPELFTGLGKLKKPYMIQLRPDAVPFSQCMARRIAVPQLQLVKAELGRIERLGVIAKVTQPTDWCVGFVVVQNV